MRSFSAAVVLLSFLGGTTSAVAPIPEASYIVVLQDSTGLSANYAMTKGHVFTKALNGFEATMAPATAGRLARDPAVAYLAPNETHQIEPLGTQPNPPSWGLDRIDQRTLPLDNSYTFPNTASNVHAYVMTTGIRVTHTDFGGRAIHGWDSVDNDGDASDCNGHGTYTAGIVGGAAHGVAKGALHNRSGGSADNIHRTYPVGLSSELRNGTWRLKVQDHARADVGYLDSWTVRL